MHGPLEERALGPWIDDRLQFGGGGGLPGEWDRSMAYRDARAAVREASCGAWLLLLRHRESGGRLVAPMTCGLRSCESCGERARLNARDRVVVGPAAATVQAREVEWTVMLTLTSPRSYPSAWEECESRDPVIVARNMGAWVGRFLKELVRKWNVRRGWYRDWKGAHTHYAWVIEAHPEDPRWVHVHVAMSLDAPRMKRNEFVRFRRWMSYRWDEITGAVEKPYRRTREKCGTWGIFDRGQGNGLSRVHWEISKKRGRWSGGYLVKYLSKGHYTRFLLAAMYRRRLVGSTLTKARKEPSGWEVLAKIDDGSQAARWIAGLELTLGEAREDEARRIQAREDQEAADWIVAHHTLKADGATTICRGKLRARSEGDTS